MAIIKTYLGPKATAELCGVHTNTVSHWLRDGLLKAHKLPSGWHRIHKDDLIEFLNQQNMPMPEELKES